MQPHSMCVVSLLGLVWNASSPIRVSKAVMRVEFTKQGSILSHSYDLTNIRESKDRLELKVNVVRAGGGLSCDVIARRTSAEEGSEITMTHETIHVSGLREVYNLYKLKVANGMSYNSEKYKTFAGEFQTDDYKKLDLVCEVKQKDDNFVPIKYQIERTDLILG